MARTINCVCFTRTTITTAVNEDSPMRIRRWRKVKALGLSRPRLTCRQLGVARARVIGRVTAGKVKAVVAMVIGRIGNRATGMVAGSGTAGGRGTPGGGGKAGGRTTWVARSRVQTKR